MTSVTGLPWLRRFYPYQCAPISIWKFQINHILRHLIPRIFFSQYFHRILEFSTFFWFNRTYFVPINVHSIRHIFNIIWCIKYEKIIFSPFCFDAKCKKMFVKIFTYIMDRPECRRLSQKYFNYANPNDVPCDNKFSRLLFLSGPETCSTEFVIAATSINNSIGRRMLPKPGERKKNPIIFLTFSFNFKWIEGGESVTRKFGNKYHLCLPFSFTL